MASSFVPYIPSDGDNASIKIITSSVSASIPAYSRNNTGYLDRDATVLVPKYTLFAMIRQTAAATVSVTALNSSAVDFGYSVLVATSSNSSLVYSIIHSSDDHMANIPIGSSHVETFPASNWVLIDDTAAYSSISQASSIVICLSDRYNHRHDQINWSNSAFNFEILFATAVVQ